ncbi:hypothetical protein GCM10010193_18540 [Kitasatospora atroaurantiaca]
MASTVVAVTADTAQAAIADSILREAGALLVGGCPPDAGRFLRDMELLAGER